MTAKTYLALIVVLLCLIFVISITGCAVARINQYEFQEGEPVLVKRTDFFSWLGSPEVDGDKAKFTTVTDIGKGLVKVAGTITE